MASEAYRKFRADPFQRGLQFKDLGSGLVSARINDSYRVVGIRERDDVLWIWIGDHDEYLRVIRQLR